MSVVKEKFGVTPDGKEVSVYTIDNGTISASVIDFGAILTELCVPDRDGKTDDIVLGYPTLEGYLANGCFFGATVAPSANRIAGASFVIDGTEYHLPVNDGENNLHTDHDFGGHKKIWDAEIGENAVTFRTTFADGEFGMPGNRRIAVTYTLTDDNAVCLTYHAESDKNTIMNPTNHSYFNLAGHASGKIYDQKLQLFCSAYTPVVKGAIPTGEIRPVNGTAFDFLTMKTIGQDIDQNDQQLELVGGFDHNFVIDGYQGDGSLLKTACAVDEESGRTMEVETTLPGVQFYAGNFIDGVGGKDGCDYGPRDGFCLETQFYPDTIHHENFPGCVFGPDRPYDSVTIYRFGTK